MCLASSLHAQTPRTEAEVYAYRQAMQSANRDLQSGNVQAAFATIKAQAELGFVEAQYILATLYHDGEGTAQDIAQAKLWYERAAAQSDNAENRRVGTASVGRIGAAVNKKAACTLRLLRVACSMHSFPTFK